MIHTDLINPICPTRTTGTIVIDSLQSDTWRPALASGQEYPGTYGCDDAKCGRASSAGTAITSAYEPRAAWGIIGPLGTASGGLRGQP
jgi:hypothetical protein